MFVRTLLAMKRATFSGISTRSASAFLRRMATLVSMSGGWMSAIKPHSKRLWRRSSRVGICRGGQSLEITICFWPSWRALKMWKNSSWVRSLPGDELDVVHQQHVDRAVLLAEGGQAVEADGVDHLVDEAVRGDVDEDEPLLPGLDVVADRVHEVGLAEAHPAVDEERVVGLARDLRDRAGRRVRKLVGGADHEAVEGVLRIEGRGLALGGRGDRRPAVLPRPPRRRPAPPAVRGRRAPP